MKLRIPKPVKKVVLKRLDPDKLQQRRDITNVKIRGIGSVERRLNSSLGGQENLNLRANYNNEDLDEFDGNKFYNNLKTIIEKRSGSPSKLVSSSNSVKPSRNSYTLNQSLEINPNEPNRENTPQFVFLRPLGSQQNNDRKGKPPLAGGRQDQ